MKKGVGMHLFCYYASPGNEKKNDNWLFFKLLVLTCTMFLVLLDNLLQIMNIKLEISQAYLL